MTALAFAWLVRIRPCSINCLDMVPVSTANQDSPVSDGQTPLLGYWNEVARRYDAVA